MGGSALTLGIRPEHIQQATSAQGIAMPLLTLELLGADNLAHGQWGGRVLLPAYPMRKCLRWVVHYIYIYRQRRCTFLIQIADYGWNHE